MSNTDCSSGPLTFWKLGTQQVTVDFSGGRVVSDAGLRAVRRLGRGLGVLPEPARRLPDPRAQKLVTHDCERILVQSVYQILAGYFDFNDANALRCDPLFQLPADVSPGDERPLASGSTLGGSSSPIWRVRRRKSITAFTYSAATFPNGRSPN